MKALRKPYYLVAGANDVRMAALTEFCRCRGPRLKGERVRLIHCAEFEGAISVPYGTGTRSIKIHSGDNFVSSHMKRRRRHEGTST